MRAKANMALAPPSLSGRSNGAPGVMTNARDAIKMAQTLAEELQLTGIQCVEAIVEWMLEAGAKAECVESSFRATHWLVRARLTSPLSHVVGAYVRGVFSKPPPFLWRERNYFLKMHSDLDFAQPALEARGVFLECYRQQNPLLVRPSQKLGRVLAAQAIIAEMVELASNSGRPVYQQVDHGFEKQSIDDDNMDTRESERPEDTASDPDEHETRGSVNDHATTATIRFVELEDDPTADMMIQNEEVEDADENEPCQVEAPSDDEQETQYHSDEGDDNVSAAPYQHGLDTSSADELVHMLDESLSDLVALPRTFVVARGDDELEQLAELSARTNEPAILSARDRERSASGYDDVFDDEAGNINAGDNDPDDNAGGDNDGGNDGSGNDVVDDNDAGDNVGGDDDMERSTENQSSHEAADLRSGPDLTDRVDIEEATTEPFEKPVLLPEHDDPLRESDVQDGATTSLDEDDNQKTETDDSDQVSAEVDTTLPHPPHTLEVESPSHQLLAVMTRLSQESGSTAPDMTISIADCLSWTNEKLVIAAMQSHERLDAALAGSFYAALAAFQLSPALKRTEELLLTTAATTTQLARHLWHECVCITDSVYGYLASQLERALESVNSLVSEIEVDEALELTESVLVDVDSSSWSHLRTAIEFLHLLRSRREPTNDDNDSSERVSTGVSRLVKVYYPYLINLPREKLPSSWRRIARTFATTSSNLNDLVFLMDPTCKTLLLAAIAGVRSGGEDAMDTSADDTAMFSKLSIVCERGNVLGSSTAAVASKVFEAKSVERFQFVLYPFFRSPFGEKVVDGVRVEEGEGKGPLKEWITLISSEMTAKWTDVALDASVVAEDSVDVHDNKLVAPGLGRHVLTGYEVSWQSGGDQSVVRVVNQVVDDDTVLMDRAVTSRQSFLVSELTVRRPRPCFLEHMRASESFWINVQTVDGPDSRRVLRFYGWYLAVAVAHYIAVDIPLHRLFFRLLVDESHSVSLADVRSLDSMLHDSLVALKTMSRSDFQAFLALEEADASLTVDEYIERTVAEQFGPESNIGWQFRELRAGFQTVFSLTDLNAASIDSDDLAAVVCGSTSTRDADFNVDEVFRVALDPDFVACEPLRRVFWRVVNAFEPALKRKFVKFVSGVETLPLPGTEVRIGCWRAFA